MRNGNSRNCRNGKRLELSELETAGTVRTGNGRNWKNGKGSPLLSQEGTTVCASSCFFSLFASPLQFPLLQTARENLEKQVHQTQHQRAEECRHEPLDRESRHERGDQPQHQRVDNEPEESQT
jgi:hypothetical protein